VFLISCVIWADIVPFFNAPPVPVYCVKIAYSDKESDFVLVARRMDSDDINLSLVALVRDLNLSEADVARRLPAAHAASRTLVEWGNHGGLMNGIWASLEGARAVVTSLNVRLRSAPPVVSAEIGIDVRVPCRSARRFKTRRPAPAWPFCFAPTSGPSFRRCVSASQPRTAASTSRC
jgi:hypothetical protein